LEEGGMNFTSSALTEITVLNDSMNNGTDDFYTVPIIHAWIRIIGKWIEHEGVEVVRLT